MQQPGYCFERKWAKSIVPNIAYMRSIYDISRRALQRTRAKLARLGLIEHISYLNSRYGGQDGWKLSSRFSTALQLLATKLEQWRQGTEPSLNEKEEMLAGLLNPQ